MSRTPAIATSPRVRHHLLIACSVLLHGLVLNHVGRPDQSSPPERPITSKPPNASVTIRIGKIPAAMSMPRDATTPKAPQSNSATTPESIENQLAVQPSAPEATPSTPQQDTNIEVATSELLDGRYWPGKLLDQRPQAQTSIVVPFPDGFISTKSGRAVLQLFINEHGIIDNIEVVDVEGPVEFVDLAKRTIQLARFSPGMINHTAVRSTIKIEIAFQQDDLATG